MELGQHAVFILASYGAVALVTSGLIFWLVADGRRLGSALADLEAKGVRRRSSSGDR
jgi:heme exporter protein D